jgi:uncharacterized Fe-S cluster-containing protein
MQRTFLKVQILVHAQSFEFKDFHIDDLIVIAAHNTLQTEVRWDYRKAREHTHNLKRHINVIVEVITRNVTYIYYLEIGVWQNKE